VAEAKGKAAERARWPTLAEDNDGELRAGWREHRVRFLLSDGRTVDVRTTRDDSDLRGALLDYLGGGQLAIVGSVVVPMVDDS
jgi:hypothetical protein